MIIKRSIEKRLLELESKQGARGGVKVVFLPSDGSSGKSTDKELDQLRRKYDLITVRFKRPEEE